MVSKRYSNATEVLLILNFTNQHFCQFNLMKYLATFERKGKGKRRPDWTPLEFTHLPGKNNNISQYLWEYEKGYKVAICRTEKTQKPTKIRLMQTMKGILWQDAGVCHGQQQLTKLRIFSAIANSKKVNYFLTNFQGLLEDFNNPGFYTLLL